ncbi:MAG TPA: DUF1579 domain-containing protein [Candidatus Krumholzibacteria bacterium]|nr:DUF1579 domain-containing protein [Candidatus Krumholzibacteria bacterium]
MSKRVWICVLVGCCIFALPVFAQESKQPSQAEMEAMMAAATPGPHHQAMAKTVGTWEMSSKMWAAPGAPPMESTGTATIEGIMDGRFVMETIKAPMMGMPWEGRGVWGYDNTTKKHMGIWFDSFGTMMMNMEGTCDGACKVVTMKSTYMDPMTKSMKTMKSVSKTLSDDHTVNELFDVDKDGKETKMMEITYKRKKA